MASVLGDESNTTTPFLLRLFYRHGTIHRPEEFTSATLPQHTLVYLGQDCTLDELALELAATEPWVLPTPAIGTRLVFQLICPDLRSTSAAPNRPPRFAVKDLGSVVIGSGGPGVDDALGYTASDDEDGAKKLSDARFVVGDYVSCAILPPNADGSVVPATAAWKESGGPHARDRRQRGGGEFARDRGRGDRSRGGSWRSGGGRDFSDDSFPHGQWRRGDHRRASSDRRRDDFRW